jgi:hypothetical protein
MTSFQTPAARLSANVLFVLLAVSGITAAAAVKAGDVCGPDHDKTARWISVPATGLVASGARGSVNTIGACVTSDKGFSANVQVTLPSGTWNVYNLTARMKANSPVSDSALVSILIGDAGQHSLCNGRLKFARQPVATLVASCCNTLPAGLSWSTRVQCLISTDRFTTHMPAVTSCGTASRCLTHHPAAAADVPAAWGALRGPDGAKIQPEVYKHFSRCATRRLSALTTEKKYSFECQISRDTMSGQYVSEHAVELHAAQRHRWRSAHLKNQLLFSAAGICHEPLCAESM